jgi:response regulator RpfG family c-di-GMP phosphodiesterase
MHHRVEANIAELSKGFKPEDGYRERLGKLAIVESERQTDTAVHAVGVLDVAAQIAESLNVSSEWLTEFKFAVRWHDIGKLAVPDDVFRKGVGERFSDEEWEQMRDHAAAGIALVGDDAPQMLKNVILYHHEAYNGRGYQKVKGEDIPLEARICQVADIYDALCRKRDYKSALSEETVLKMMTDDVAPPSKGRLDHDPFILRRFIQLRLQDQNLNISDESRQELTAFSLSDPMSDFGKKVTGTKLDYTAIFENGGWNIDKSGHRILFRDDSPRSPKIVELRDPTGVLKRREKGPALETDVDYTDTGLKPRM